MLERSCKVETTTRARSWHGKVRPYHQQQQKSSRLLTSKMAWPKNKIETPGKHWKDNKAFGEW
jgi:hypothetical protein